MQIEVVARSAERVPVATLLDALSGDWFHSIKQTSFRSHLSNLIIKGYCVFKTLLLLQIY
jgi:hypothetical protein